MGPEERARSLPDIPRLVETRAMLLSGRCRVFEGADLRSYVVRSTDQLLGAVVGAPGARVIREAVASIPGGFELLAGEDDASAVVEALPGWKAERAIIHALPDPWPRWTVPAADIRLLTPEDLLAHLPQGLRQEIEEARLLGPVSVALVADLPVSFCYAGSVTEGLWDISIDTLAPYRSRGLGRAAVQHLALHFRELGKAPVWGALEKNLASRRLAAALGFVPVDTLGVFASAARVPEP